MAGYRTNADVIAEARERARKRQALIARRGAAVLILGSALAGAGFLQYHRYVRQISIQLDIEIHVVHPWWVYTATVALCVLGVAGAAGVLGNAHRAFAIGQATAGVLFLVAGIGAIEDTGLGVVNNYGVFGHANLGAAFLLLAFLCARLARTFWLRLPGLPRPRA